MHDQNSLAESVKNGLINTEKALAGGRDEILVFGKELNFRTYYAYSAIGLLGALALFSCLFVALRKRAANRVKQRMQKSQRITGVEYLQTETCCDRWFYSIFSPLHKPRQKAVAKDFGPDPWDVTDY
jgi:hypothetical protein